MDFFLDNDLDKKHLIMVDYKLDHYSQKGFWFFEIIIPHEYSFIFEDDTTNPLLSIIPKTRKLILNTEYHYFVIDGLDKDSLDAFNKFEPFYFKLYEEAKNEPNSPILLIKEKVLNTFSCNPLKV